MFERAFFVAYNDPYEPPKPVYTHDCDRCVFVGQAHMKAEPGIADVYVCNDSILARIGNEGSEYTSCSMRDYMHVLIGSSDYVSDTRWLIIQLYETKILKLQASFTLPNTELPDYCI